MESTTRLLNELNQISDSVEAFQAYRELHPQDPEMKSLKEYLNCFMSSHPDLVQKDIIRNAGQSKDYGNQIFNGRRTHPGKYILVSICICMGMSVKETNRALFLAGCAQLSPRDNLDAALIVCINHGYRTLADINDYLASVSLEPI